MYQFLKGTGFGKFNTYKKQDFLKKYVINHSTRKREISLNEDETICISEKDTGSGIGIAVIEIINKEGDSCINSFFPYVKGLNYLYYANPEFEKFTDRFSYACICDENNLGIPLIFHVNNIIDYLYSRKNMSEINSMVLSGIASKGVVILPIEKNEYQERKEKRENELRNKKIDAAKAGDIEAMEELTLEDMDTYTMVTGRSKKEDIFTIVTSYFMPYTVECDKYSVLGDILSVSEIKNQLTQEELYYISIDCNSIQIEFTIAKSEITGIPDVGRRFKGYIWLQGEVDYI